MVSGSFRFRDLADAYRDIALRHLQVAQILLQSGFYDIIVFHCYHAMESIACSALALSGVDATEIKTHRTKLEKFRDLLFQSRPPFATQAAELITEIQEMRSTTLYPEGVPLDPSSKFTQAQAADMFQRVDNLVRRVRNYLGI